MRAYPSGEQGHLGENWLNSVPIRGAHIRQPELPNPCEQDKLMATGPLGVVRRQASFVGNYRHVVDAQGRIQVPRAIRKAMLPESQGTLYVTRGLDGCLFAYPLDTWQNLAEQWELALNDARSFEKRNEIRVMTSHACEARLDGQGRISIPAYLLKAVDIRSEALFVGVTYRIEIWNPDRYEAAIAAAENSFEQNMRNLVSFRQNRQSG